MNAHFVVPSARLAQRGLVLAFAGLMAGVVPLRAGVTHFGVFKGQNYEQKVSDAPTPDSSDPFGAYFFVHTAAANELALGTVQSGGSSIPLILDTNFDDPLLAELDLQYGTLTELDAVVPDGTVQFSLFDSAFMSQEANLSISGNAYPAATGLSNFAAAQQIDPKQAFTLQWTAPAGMTATDYVLINLENRDGDLLATPLPWQVSPLAGTVNSFTIPANTLTGEDLAANFTFIRVTARNTTALAGATGMSGYFSSTQIPLKLKGGGTGGDTTPPTLLASVPTQLATGVPTGTPLVLSFSEPMQKVQEVNWVNVPNSASIVYAWSNDGRNLTCTLPGGFPANTMVIWALTKTALKDLAGNALGGNFIGGAFTTAGSNPEPCALGVNERKNLFFVLKEISHEQTSAADPLPGGDPVASFGSFFAPAPGTTATAASVRLPSGEVRNLSAAFGNYFLNATAASESALNTAFPAGNYTGAVTVGGSTGNLALPMVAAPPVPKCANYDVAQQVNPAASFGLQWNAFTGATGNDRLEFILQDDTGKTLFQAPNECAQPPVTLANGATSVTLAAGLLQTGKTYHCELRFMKVSDVASQTAPAYQGATGYSKVTHFTLKTTGGSSGGTLVIKAFRMPADGRFEVDAQGTAGQTVFLEAWLNFTTWEPVNGNLVGADGLITLKDQRLQVPSSQLYRVRSQ